MRRRVLGASCIARVQTWDGEALAPQSCRKTCSASLGPRDTGTVASGRAEVICVGPTDWVVLATEPDAAWDGPAGRDVRWYPFFARPTSQAR